MDAQQIDIARLISLRKLAKKFDKHPITVMRWARDGLIPGPIRVGRTIYFDEAAVSAALASNAGQGR